MAQYAIEGYEVNAIDFMVKPVGYYNFSLKLEKAFRFYQSRKAPDILISSKDGIRRINVSDILYIEKNRDNVIFHTREEVFEERGSIKAMKEKLAGLPFEECTSGCLVNLNCVKRVGKDSISLTGSVELPLSRRLKRQFTQEYINFVGMEG
jgi:DNA-binding LytR/AlgR family response regulator